MSRRKIALNIEVTRAMPSSCVVIGFPFRVNQWCLDGFGCGALPLAFDNFDNSALAYAVFTVVRDGLLGSVAEMAKNKATSVSCGAQDGDFIISVVCDRSFSSARKCAGNVVKNLRFGSMWDAYSTCCRSTGVKPNKDAFYAAAEEACKGLAHLSVTMIGRFENLSKENEKKAVETISKKIKESDPAGKGARRNVAAEAVASESKGVDAVYSTLTASGINGVILKSYVDAMIKGITTKIVDGKLYFPSIKERAVHALADKDRISRFTDQLERLQDPAGAVIFMAAKSCLTPVRQLAIKDKMGAGIEAALKKALE
jgi:hypothetical protein